MGDQEDHRGGGSYNHRPRMETSGNGVTGVVPEETRSDVRAHGFCRQGPYALFDVCFVNLEAGSYLHMMSEKDIEKAEKDKKYRYLQDCLEHRRHFTSLVFSADKIPGNEAWFATWKMASHLSFKLKREYYEMCNSVRAMMDISVVQFNTLLLRGTHKKEAIIRHHPELLDGAVMELTAP